MNIEVALEISGPFHLLYNYSKTRAKIDGRPWNLELEFVEMVRVVNPGLGKYARDFFPAWYRNDDSERLQYLSACMVDLARVPYTPINWETANEVSRTNALGKLTNHSFDLVYLYVMQDLGTLWARFLETESGQKYRPIGSDALGNDVNAHQAHLHAVKMTVMSAPKPDLSAAIAPHALMSANEARDAELNLTRKPPKPHVPSLTAQGIENIANQRNFVPAPNSAAPPNAPAPSAVLSLTPKGAQLMLTQQTRAELQQRAASKTLQQRPRVQTRVRSLPPLPPVPYQIPVPVHPKRLPPIKIVGFRRG
jgi:hypothetical protein